LAAVPARGNIRVRGNRAVCGGLTALVCALIALAVPALASAAQHFVVDGTADVQSGNGCEVPAAGECTLPGAIEAANADSSRDVITFSSDFDGEVAADEIDMTTPLPEIIEPVAIEGPSCFLPGYDAPCVGLSAAPGDDAFVVEANEVQISGLSITGGKTGIDVLAGSTGFEATGNWLGLKLDGSEEGADTAGIVLGPGADGAIIGAEEEEEINRNVFDDSKEGVRIEGASGAKVLGNYIGVDPAGNGPASLEVGVQIVDAEGTPGSEAKDDEVGGILSAAQAASTECDGPCNVIATEGGNAVDLTGVSGQGVKAASGPTWIRGNYIGLAADGVDDAGENSYGVFAAPTEFGCEAGPADVTVGGAAPTETNYIEGGTTGVFAEGAENFRASGNEIGIAADGSAVESPSSTAISLCAAGVTRPAHVSANDMILEEHGIGIESDFGEAEIAGNSIEGGQIGVFVLGEGEGSGDLISANTVTDPEFDGIRVLSGDNVLIGNSINDAAAIGINLEGADHNRIGGDLAGEENNIDGSGGGAILIEGEEALRDEVAGNIGSGNAGAFIQLIGTQPGERPNAGVEPPILGTVLQSSATGTAEPGATVRIFSKASAEAGELASLLAVVKADALGNWKASYAKVPVATLVAATQTSDAGTAEAGTSEVSAPDAAAADPVEPGGGGGSNGSGSSTATPQSPAPAVPPKRKAPKVTITKRPKKSSKSTTAKFTFKATPPAGTKFQCKLDNAKWASCGSPKTYKKLKPRKHTFQVRATVSGVTGAATKFKFRVRR
jgi:hypothetical protein